MVVEEMLLKKDVGVRAKGDRGRGDVGGGGRGNF